MERPGAGARRIGGLCIDSIILPRAVADSADSAAGVQVELMPASEYLGRLTENRYPLIRSDFEVYLAHNTLIYAKAECTPADLDGWIFAHSELLETAPAEYPLLEDLGGRTVVYSGISL